MLARGRHAMLARPAGLHSHAHAGTHVRLKITKGCWSDKPNHPSMLPASIRICTCFDISAVVVRCHAHCNLASTAFAWNARGGNCIKTGTIPRVEPPSSQPSSKNCVPEPTPGHCFSDQSLAQKLDEKLQALHCIDASLKGSTRTLYLRVGQLMLALRALGAAQHSSIMHGLSMMPPGVRYARCTCCTCPPDSLPPGVRYARYTCCSCPPDSLPAEEVSAPAAAERLLSCAWRATSSSCLPSSCQPHGNCSQQADAARHEADASQHVGASATACQYSDRQWASHLLLLPRTDNLSRP